MVKKPKKLSEQLRDAILTADKTRYRIAKETGLTEAGLSRFVNGVAGLSLDSIDKIGVCLGLEIKPRTKHRKSR
jgi:plasmid maintenance system antidote protein VapI